MILAPQGISVKATNRVATGRKRALFHGGVFAPPGYDEIVHIVSFQPRDLLPSINAANNLSLTWTTGTNQNVNIGNSGGFYLLLPSRGNSNNWGVIRFFSDQWTSTFLNLPDLPDTMKPIYINPSHYLPQEITVSYYGVSANAQRGGVAIYFYNRVADEFNFFAETLPTVKRYGWSIGIFSQYNFLNNGHVILGTNLFSRGTTSGATAVQQAYWSYAPQDLTNDQDSAAHAITFPFPLRSGLFDNQGNINPNVRIAIVPFVMHAVVATNFPAYPVVGVSVKCTSQT